MYGRKVIETVGSAITALHPAVPLQQPFPQQLRCGCYKYRYSGISNTNLSGCCLGVGLARGIGALNLIVIRNIFMSWILTLPAASILTILSYKVLHWFLG